jgi:imidazoleglycerol-phosphate dehydratase
VKDMKIQNVRKTMESVITVRVNDGGKNLFYINSPLNFFNHMVQTISWRSGISMDIRIELLCGRLNHMICEDTGITLGKAIFELAKKKIKNGVNMAGYSISCLDESLSVCAIGIEGRRNCYINFNNKKIAMKFVEDTFGYDLIAFLEGFSQGMNSTINIKVLNGNDPHHLWESVFRALGDSIKMALDKNPGRKNVISGIKGVLD